MVLDFFSLPDEDVLSAFSTLSNFPAKIVTPDFVFLWHSGQRQRLPILTAHADTVLKPCIYDCRKDIFIGKGFDDRAGCFLLWLFCTSKLSIKFHALVTNHEEVGCLGAEAFLYHFPSLPSIANLVIGLDFPGNLSFTDYGYPHKPTNQFFLKLGFKRKQGIFSDCSYIAAATDIPCLNLSVGYYFPHSHKSILSLSALRNTASALSVFLTRFVSKTKQKGGENG